MLVSLRCLLLVALLGVCGGCGAVFGRATVHGSLGFFAGVQWDYQVLLEAWSQDHGSDGLWGLAACLDMPLSLLLDLILLPVDALASSAATGDAEPSEPGADASPK